MSETRVGFFVGPFFISTEAHGIGLLRLIFFLPLLLLALIVAVVLAVTVGLAFTLTGVVFGTAFKLWARFWLAFNPHSASDRDWLHHSAAIRIRDAWMLVPRLFTPST